MLFLIAPGGWPVQSFRVGPHISPLEWRCQVDAQRRSLGFRLYLHEQDQPPPPCRDRLLEPRHFPWPGSFGLRPDAPPELTPDFSLPFLKDLTHRLYTQHLTLDSIDAAVSSAGISRSEVHRFLKGLASAGLLLRSPIPLRDIQSPFDFLGLHWRTGVDEIRRAYRFLSSRVTGQTMRLRLQAAHQLLNDPFLRRRIRRRMVATGLRTHLGEVH